MLTSESSYHCGSFELWTMKKESALEEFMKNIGVMNLDLGVKIEGL